MRKDPEETYSLKEKLAVTAVLLLPEILEQLNLDYQDVYDYYGGAEEIW